MGQDKAWLQFGAETMLERIVRIVSEVVTPVVVVAAADQRLPELPNHVEIVPDRMAGSGPLEGLRSGLATLAGRTELAYVTSCDAPLLQPAFMRRVIELLGDASAAVPYVNNQYQPLAGVYRTDIVRILDELLYLHQLALQGIFLRINVRKIEPQELIEVDPELHSLLNLNDPAAYANALKIAGF